MVEKEFIVAMKRRNFVDDIKGWTRKFTFVSMVSGEIFIGHRIEGKIGKLTKVEGDVDEWIKYFDRI